MEPNRPANTVADDEPGVLAINPADLPPLATEADHKAAYRRLWIEYMVSLGIPEDFAGSEFDAAPWDDIKGMDYKLAAETAMEVWDVE